MTVALVEPRIMSVPPYVSTLGDDAIELARKCGLILDPWQEFVVRRGLSRKDDGKWGAFEVAMNIPRQNGKNGVFEAVELAKLFLVGERMQTHTAHLQDTSMEAMRRLIGCIEEGGLEGEVKAVRRTNGQEGIELTQNRRIRFRTRTSGGGRGFSSDTVYFDEAMFLQEFFHGALVPTLSAMPNPQMWYGGSAVDQEVHEHGIVFARIRERGLAGADPSLAYFEWSFDLEDPAALDDNTALDPESWRVANPALGIRIDPAYIVNEFRSMDHRTFAVERLGVGDWPATDRMDESLIKFEEWAKLERKDSVLQDPIVLTYDVSPDRRGSIVASGRNQDGELHVELIQNRHGTRWIAKKIAELVDRYDVSRVVADGFGPAACVTPSGEEEQITVDPLNSADLGRACGFLVAAVAQGAVRHLGSPEIASAIRGAKPRPLGDAWAWSRKNSSVDISPLVAMTQGLWAASLEPEAGEVAIY